MAFESPWKNILGQSPFRLQTYTPPTEKKSWWQMSPVEQMAEMQRQRQTLAGIPDLPDKKTLRERAKPLLNTLQVIGGVLNVPSAAISGAAKQLIDGAPGFDAQEYFRDVFGFKDQVSWRDVIGILAERDEDENVWDTKWAQIAAGLTLDILLDPLTYFGAGYLKASKATKQGAVQVANATQKLLKAKAPWKANRAAMDVLNRGFRRVWGIQLPFSPTVAVPFRGKGGRAMTGLVTEAGERLARTAPEKIAPVAGQYAARAARITKGTPTFLHRIANLGRKVPGSQWILDAFAPNAQAKLGIIAKKMDMMHQVGDNPGQLWSEVIEPLVKGRDHAQLRKITELMEELPYVNQEIVEKNLAVSTLTTRFIRRYLGGKKDANQILKQLSKRNQEATDELRKGLIKVLKDRQALKQHYKAIGLKAPLPEKMTEGEILRAMGHVFDETSAKQAKIYFKKAGINAEGLENLASFEPKLNIDEIYKKLGDGFTFEQKQSVLETLRVHREILDNWIDAERANGYAINYVRNYMSRMTSKGRSIGILYELTGRPGFTMKRYSDLSLTQRFDAMVDELIDSGAARSREHAAKLLKMGKKEEYGKVVETFAEALYLRGIAHKKAMALAEFADGVKQFGLKVRKGISIPSSMKPIGNMPQLDGFLFQIDDAKYINRAMSTLRGDRGMNAFLKAIDKGQGWWKLWATTINPGFHFRNFYSNNFLGWVRHGARFFRPSVHQDAMSLVLEALHPKNKALWKAMEPFGVNKGRLRTSKYADTFIGELLGDLKKGGTIRHGVRITDETMRRGLEASTKVQNKLIKRLNLVGPEGAFAKLGDELAGLIESEARVASFLLEYDNIADATNAIRQTQAVFVDYANKTVFEKEFVSRLIPFYSWLKQNTVNQVKFIFTQPGRYAKISRVAQALEAGADKEVPEKWKPDWFRQLWMWQLPISMPDGTPLFFNPNFPFQDLNKLNPNPEQMRQNFLTSLSPMLTLPLEQLTGYDVFWGEPIERYPGYKAPVPGLLQTFVAAMPKKFKDSLDKDFKGRYVMNPQAAQAITTLFPFVNNMARMLMREPETATKDRFFQWVSYMWGVKIKPLDTLTQEYYYTREEIRRRKDKLKELGM